MRKRMAYEAPKCCGANLQVFADVDLAARVTSDGKPSMRTPTVFGFMPKSLFCQRCKTRYKVSLDDQGRVVKGSVS